MKKVIFTNKAIYLFVLLVFVFGAFDSSAQTYTISGAGTAGVNGIYVQNGIHGSDNRPRYDNTNGLFFVYHDYATVYSQAFWVIDNDLDDEGSVLYFWNQPDPVQTTMPLGSSWVAEAGSGSPTSSQNATADITFTNGSSYTPPSGTPNTINNPIGRFNLSASISGAVLQSVTVALAGIRSGVTNVKLWSSTDASFGSDTQLGSSVSDNTSVTFSGFNNLVATGGGTYYFVTMDLGAGATGEVTATIPSQASFTFATGSANAPAAFSDAPLTSGATPLPVELNSFSAAKKGNLVELKWNTATEVNNYGFEVERLQDYKITGLQNWEKIGFVQGSGNSNSVKSYSYTDNSKLSSGSYSYRLKQIDNDGQFEYSNAVEVLFNAPAEFSLKQNYPNPFNPVTNISYSLAEKSQVSLTVYDVLGREVVNLVNKEQESGVYDVQFDAGTLNSGIYFYQIKAGNFSEVKKLMLIK